METGPPDPKRARLGSGSWSNGHPISRGVLPPLGPSSQYPPPQPFSRTGPQGQLHHVEDRRHHEPEYLPPGQDQRPHTVGPNPYQSFGPPREPMIKRDHSAEPPQQSQYHRPHSTGDIIENNAVSFPQGDPRRQNTPYETPNGPPMNNQPYRPPPGYPQPMYTPTNPPYERQAYDPPPTPGGLRDQIHLNIAYASSSGPGYNRRKAPRTSQVGFLMSCTLVTA
jgi:hypothetical protein